MSVKRFNVYVLLSLFFVALTISSESVGPKIVDVKAVLPFLNYLPYYASRDLLMSAGVLMWPLVFITTDIINHYFGKRGVIQISYITAGLLIFTFSIYFVASILPPAAFWLDVNRDVAVNDINVAYNRIFMQSTKIIAGSVTAFLLGQLLDAYTYHWLRKFTNEKLIWFRALASTFFSQLIDSYLVILIAFYFLGDWTMMQIASVGTAQFIFKIMVAIVLTPLLYLVHYVIDLYLGKDIDVDFINFKK
jgi:uncharacterized integral membrane protein (TIGR00697 family)